MNCLASTATEMTARAQGWVLWLLVVLGVAFVGLGIGALRRYFLRPMTHRPTDTTDAWAEAGRRMKPEPETPGEPGEEET